ncbi:peroxide stress protein YaaA [Curtobacterium sp. RHCKG28]|uniref:Peroxide stress protein YaaA n=1 Tax=Curtobacterium caseinilyticum TaxID=3055137 RepID=A0ABT7TLB6_9MICO|nr:peroxide stress protein YaaA [Curtobacterium caseinilyticum]MDM7890378.1 peroxide stress protein YaaA [Curtobacterium caseinilyticum]
MTVLLPPSETKREGGDPTRTLDLGALSFPELADERAAVITAARSVSSEESTARTALKLGPRSIAERFRNLALDGAPTLPAIERYTGVLYDPLEAASADQATTRWWADHVVVQSAMFGPVGAGDRIPAYRLSHDSRLGALRLAKHWPDAAARALATRSSGLVLDLRSEGYRALGPVSDAVVLRVVSIGAGGRRTALNHWNKTAKGRLVSLLGRSAPDVADMDDLVAWAEEHGVAVERTADGWDLVAESLEPVRA